VTLIKLCNIYRYLCVHVCPTLLQEVSLYRREGEMRGELFQGTPSIHVCPTLLQRVSLYRREGESLPPPPPTKSSWCAPTYQIQSGRGAAAKDGRGSPRAPQTLALGFPQAHVPLRAHLG
jgi:hypothetical protein